MQGNIARKSGEHAFGGQHCPEQRELRDRRITAGILHRAERVGARQDARRQYKTDGQQYHPSREPGGIAEKPVTYGRTACCAPNRTHHPNQCERACQRNAVTAGAAQQHERGRQSPWVFIARFPAGRDDEQRAAHQRVGPRGDAVLVAQKVGERQQRNGQPGQWRAENQQSAH